MKRRDFLALLSATSAHTLATQTGFAKAAHDTSTNTAPVARFAVLGDMGTGERSQYSLAAGMAAFHEQHPFDTILTLGDNIYPSGEQVHFKDKFELPYAELLKREVRFYATLGNHDVRRGRDAQMKYAPFNMNGRPYYSFVKGERLIEFFALDSTWVDAAQLRWLAGALAASQAQWKIAYFHHPLYSSGITHGSYPKLRAQFEPLFTKYGVTAVLSGHDHTYERTKRQQGVQYFVAGAGGQLRRGDLDQHTSFFAAGNDRVNSFMYFEATPEHLTFRAVDAANNTLDDGVLTRARADAPVK